MGKIEKYCYVKNFLNNEEQSLLENYTKIFHRFNAKDFDPRQNKNLDTAKYSDPIFESLMLSKLPKMEEISGLKLLPTYTYWRMYTRFSDLKKHTDRPACQLSVTINIFSTGEDWPIFIDGTPINIKPGDAVIYWGMKYEHWREELQGDGQAQAFLHYVLANGEHKDHVYDKRIGVGYPRVG